MSTTQENQFVIQKHSTSCGGHWDLMLQMGNTLWTWRLHYSPQHIQEKPVSAEKIDDHPLRFLTYEGPVQNFTATVKIVDTGQFTMLKQTESEIEFDSNGKILTGRFQILLKQDDIWFLSRIE